MKIKVNPHTVEIVREQTEPINELEIKVSKCEFEFDEAITDDFVKEAYFTLNGNTYKQIIVNDECDYPSEVLAEKGTLEIGVVAFKVENDEEIIRYNPSPDYFESWVGSLKDAENSEPITPSDKEQIEQELMNISTQMDNLDVEASKVEHTTTITITRKDGTSYDVEVLDGEQGPQGERGPAGVIRIIICPNGLPETGEEGPLYEVPKEEPTTQDLYDEYMWVDNQWELMGEKKIAIDLTDYVKNTDYASASVGGVIKATIGNQLQVNSSGELTSRTVAYSSYGNILPDAFISKGTLDNAITGKGLITNTVNNLTNYYDKTYIDNTIGNIESILETLDIGSGV